MAVWFHRPDRFTDNPFPSSELPGEILARSGSVAQQLLEHPQLDESLALQLPHLRMRSLLILGLYDCITDDDTIELFNAGVEDGEVVWFEDSGHFCHMEEPAAFARAVLGFLGRA